MFDGDESEVSKMSELVSYDILSRESHPIQRARLAGDGWYIEVTKQDEHTLEIRCCGNIAGSGVLRVLPRAANHIHATTDVEFDRRVWEEISAELKVRESNAEFRRRKGLPCE